MRKGIRLTVSRLAPRPGGRRGPCRAGRKLFPLQTRVRQLERHRDSRVQQHPCLLSGRDGDMKSAQSVRGHFLWDGGWCRQQRHELLHASPPHELREGRTAA